MIPGCSKDHKQKQQQRQVQGPRSARPLTLPPRTKFREWSNVAISRVHPQGFATMFAFRLRQLFFAMRTGNGTKANRTNGIKRTVVILAVWKPPRRPICRDHDYKPSSQSKHLAEFGGIHDWEGSRAHRGSLTFSQSRMPREINLQRSKARSQEQIGHTPWPSACQSGVTHVPRIWCPINS